MKILLFIENSGAVAQIRLLSPFDHLKQAGRLDFDLFVMDRRQTFEYDRFDEYEAIIFQRTSTPETVELMRQAKRRGLKVIYDIDDNLLRLPQSNPLYAQFSDAAVSAAIKAHLEMADLVTVSTGVLWGALAEYAPHRAVLRNELDLAIFPAALAKSEQAVTIGYAAGLSHAADLQQVVPALKRLLEEYGSALKVIFFWLAPEVLKSHPQVEHLGGFPLLQDYAAKLREARLDIGLAPLIDSPFNGAKSDVKYLEYGSQAIAGIYSRALPYSSIVEGQTGLLVDEGDAGQWYERIKYLIDNREERLRIAGNAMLDVTEHRTVETLAQAWMATLEGLFAQAPQLPARPVVSIVMLTYNALEYTQECIESIREHTAYPHEIIFIDNASSDGSVDYLQQVVADNPHYRLIANETNRGFAAGNNQGVAAARGDYVMLLNNDVLVSSGWLRDLVAALERNPQIGMVGPVTNHISGRQAIADIPYDDTPGFHKFAGRVREASGGKLTPRRRIAGFAILMRKAIYDELGGFEEIFGSGNYEDDDLCLRVRERGNAIMVDEGTYIHHYGSKTFEANKIDYRASLSHNEKLFKERWPEIDHQWLLEKDAPLADVHKALLDEAAGMIEQGDPQAAEQICRDVILENPLSSQAYYGLGVMASRAGNQAEARRQFQAALTHDPVSAATIKRLAELDLINGNPLAAQGTMLPLLEQDPADFEARHLLARALLAQENFNDAVSLLTGIIDEAPDNWEAHLTMALLYDELGQAEEVLKHVAAVLEREPDQADAGQLLAKYNAGR